MGMKLFDDAVDGVDDLEKIEIDPEFAKRYEHNKKREDLHRYEEMKKKGIIESGSESDSESESDGVESGDDVKEFFDGILKIRKKDPILFTKEAKLFGSSDDDDDDDDHDDSELNKPKKKPKPIYIKDVNARNAIEEGANFDDEDDEIATQDKDRVKSFVKEQEDLKNEVLKAIAAEESKIGDEDDGELLKEKVKVDGDDDEVDEEIKEKIDEFFGGDEQLDEKDMFLKKFFEGRLWIDKGKDTVGGNNDEFGLSEDEEEIEKQEEYERDYNFRYEESKSDRVLGHSRFVEGSVRKVANTRKDQRERKKEREKKAEIERREEVKRLKNLKRKEIQEKLRKIREIAGVDGDEIKLDEEDLEKDFDPDEFDNKMRDAFGEEYYRAEDADPEFGVDGCYDLEKPDFSKEDELLGLPKDWDVIKGGVGGFVAKRELKNKSNVKVEIDEEEGNDDEGVVEGKRKRKRKSKIEELLKKDLEEELYKYDYEDTIGDLKTRFKYRKVKPNRFRLSAAEILYYDERELNQYVSSKKLAPYRDQEWQVHDGLYEKLREGKLDVQMKEKKRKMVDEGQSKTTDDGQGSEEIKLSRSARRRKNRQERKNPLPQDRLVAYGRKTS